MSLVRLLASLLASVLLVASALALDRAGGDRSDVTAGPSPGATDPTPGATPTPGETTDPDPSPSDPMEAERQLELLMSTDAAARADGEELLEAGLTVGRGPWRSLTSPDWPVREERPVYVAEVTIAPDGERVSADVVIAWRPEEDASELVLRLLPAVQVLEDAGVDLELSVELDDSEVDAEIDSDGARLLVPGDLVAGEAYQVRVRVSYDLVDGNTLSGQGGPAGFGILARHAATDTRPAIANLGHWLPLLAFDDGPMIEWGDVGGFPVAIWSVLVGHPGELVTGGEDASCPDESTVEVPDGGSCTWAQGVSLRDVSAVWFADAPRVDREQVGNLDVKAILPEGTHGAATNEQALRESAASVRLFEEAFGPLAWREFEVVAAPLLEGAAGMEFPGLVIIDLEVYGALNGRIGTYVIVHEVAHQWFHALVGNGSLTSPVIDEAVAQYLSYLFWAEAYGEEAAAAFAAEALRGRYEAARQRGLEDEPPAQPLAEFEGDEAYSALVYARAPLGLVEAEGRVSRAGVVRFLAGIVSEYGLEEIDDDTLLEEARAFDPALGGVLERYWFDPAPLATGSS